MPAKTKPAQPAAPITTTANDAHRHLLAGYSRKVEAARDEAKLEIKRMQQRLARLAEALDWFRAAGMIG